MARPKDVANEHNENSARTKRVAASVELVSTEGNCSPPQASMRDDAPDSAVCCAALYPLKLFVAVKLRNGVDGV